MKTSIMFIFFITFLSSSWAFADKNTPQKSKNVHKSGINKNMGICHELLAKTLLRGARDLYNANQLKMATGYLMEIAQRYPETKSAKVALKLLKTWSKMSHIDTGGRIEFITFSGLYGISLGIALPVSLSASIEVTGLSVIGFTALGIVGSIWASSLWPISEGQASSITIGTIWASWNAFVLSTLADISSSSQQTQVVALGSVLGYIGGTILGKYLHPTIGQITHASSLGVWSTGLAGAILVIMSDQKIPIKSKTALGTLLIASNVGLVGGLFLYPSLQFSRARSILINLGGFGGGALGGGIAMLAQIESVTTNILVVTGLTLSGLFLTGYLTKNMRPERKNKTMLSNGALLNFQGSQWSFDMPNVSLMPIKNKQNNWTLNLHIPIVSGQW